MADTAEYLINMFERASSFVSNQLNVVGKNNVDNFLLSLFRLIKSLPDEVVGYDYERQVRNIAFIVDLGENFDLKLKELMLKKLGASANQDVINSARSFRFYIVGDFKHEQDVKKQALCEIKERLTSDNPSLLLRCIVSKLSSRFHSKQDEITFYFRLASKDIKDKISLTSDVVYRKSNHDLAYLALIRRKNIAYNRFARNAFGLKRLLAAYRNQIPLGAHISYCFSHQKPDDCILIGTDDAYHIFEGFNLFSEFFLPVIENPMQLFTESEYRLIMSSCLGGTMAVRNDIAVVETSLHFNLVKLPIHITIPLKKVGLDDVNINLYLSAIKSRFLIDDEKRSLSMSETTSLELVPYSAPNLILRLQYACEWTAKDADRLKNLLADPEKQTYHAVILACIRAAVAEEQPPIPLKVTISGKTNKKLKSIFCR